MCPDIGLLPSLARLLKTDLNGLFCFQQDLSPQGISGQMLAAFLSKLERDGELEYLRDDARFHSLIGEFREKLNGRM